MICQEEPRTNCVNCENIKPKKEILINEKGKCPYCGKKITTEYMRSLSSHSVIRLGIEDNAQKESEGKRRWSLLPFRSLEETLKAYEYGCIKYEPHNWKKGIEFSEYIDPAMRHFTDFINGENYDKESKSHHLGCTIFYLNALIYFTINEEIYKQFDDRCKE